MLDKNNFDKAVRFIREYGRELETALLEHEFFGGPSEAVLSALAGFQNSDGGFGRALEPDFRAGASSVLCTTYAFDIMTELNVPADNGLIRSAADYLTRCMDEQNLIWRFIPEMEENYPRAPWWSQLHLEKTFNGFIENPRVKICSYMYRYPQLFGSSTAARLLGDILDYLPRRPDNASIGELLCYLELAKAPGLPDDAAKALDGKLRRMITASVGTDEASWGEYSLRPVDIVRSPDSAYMPLLKDSLDRNLTYEAESQQDDGRWLPTWNWAGEYPDAWAQAGTEWSGVITLEKLKLFRAFGLIEGL